MIADLNNRRFAASRAGAARCLCGLLLARLLPGGLELKCRRCKRVWGVHFPSGQAGSWVELQHGTERSQASQ